MEYLVLRRRFRSPKDFDSNGTEIFGARLNVLFGEIESLKLGLQQKSHHCGGYKLSIVVN
jgi:hypothetical protein